MSSLFKGSILSFLNIADRETNFFEAAAKILVLKKVKWQIKLIHMLTILHARRRLKLI